MMEGQKVVKVFCHEEQALRDFDEVNGKLYSDSSRAQAYASVLGPIIGNIDFAINISTGNGSSHCRASFTNSGYITNAIVSKISNVFIGRKPPYWIISVTLLDTKAKFFCFTDVHINL